MSSDHRGRAGSPLGIVLLIGVVGVATGACNHAGSNATAPGAEKQQDAAHPLGPPAGVARAIRAAYPDAVIDEILRPDDFGRGSDDEQPLYWVCRYHAGGEKKESSVSPEGVLVRKEDAIAAHDLPAVVAHALGEAAPGAAPSRIERQETRAGLKYVAIAKPEIVYTITMEKSGRSDVLIVQANGNMQRLESEGGEEEAPAETEESPAAQAQPAPTQDAEIPAEAAEAARAVKQIYPAAVLLGVESVPVDDGTGQLAMLYYEVECVIDGRKREIPATPDGLVVRIGRSVAPEDLPPAVAEAATREVPGGSITSATQEEERAELRFVALSQPRVVYQATVESAGKESKLRFSAAGEKIEPFNPWGR